MLPILDFVKSTKGRFSGSRLFSAAILLAVLVDWVYSIFDPTSNGIWKPSWETVGMVMGVLGYKYSNKLDNN